MIYKKYNTTDFEQMEKQFRTNFINSLSGFKSVNLVGTIDKNQLTNLAVFSQVFHIGANPALMGLLIRPDTARRHTLENIENTQFFTFNHIKQDFCKQAHQTSARYEVSEFEACELTPEFGAMHPAPYVQESDLKIGLQFAERHDLAINGTILIIGKVIETIIRQDCIGKDGYIDIENAGTITCSSLDAYHTTQKIARFSYAKSDRELSEIEGFIGSVHQI
jgi:flavin reductase (DIM6/NTAB) family NADH-FMN oxidoreductase RutF